jgi:hypothetical protein
LRIIYIPEERLIEELKRIENKEFYEDEIVHFLKPRIFFYMKQNNLLHLIENKEIVHPMNILEFEQYLEFLNTPTEEPTDIEEDIQE